MFKAGLNKMTVCNETQRTFMLKVDIESSTVCVAVVPLNLVKPKKRHFSQEQHKEETAVKFQH